MTILSEDPSFLLVVLVLVAGAFLIALRLTQQGKFLFWSLATLAIAVIVMVVELIWVTDAERIEQVVYDLRNAVLASDAEGVLAHLTPDVEYGQGGSFLPGEATRNLIRTNLEQAKFDFVHINGLQVSAGSKTKRGTAEFHVYAKGTLRLALGTYNMGTANSTWSLGFEETAPGVWKVNRITPISIPEGTIHMPSSSFHSGDRFGGRGR